METANLVRAVNGESCSTLTGERAGGFVRGYTNKATFQHNEALHQCYDTRTYYVKTGIKLVDLLLKRPLLQRILTVI